MAASWEGRLFRMAIRLHMANIRRAVIVALVVGTAFLLVNHGDHLMAEASCEGFVLKACFGYAIPFIVSLVSAFFATSGGRRDRGATARSSRGRPSG